MSSVLHRVTEQAKEGDRFMHRDLSHVSYDYCFDFNLFKRNFQGERSIKIPFC